MRATVLPVNDEPAASVGLGERRLSDDPGGHLAAYGLGSCVGLVMWGWRGSTRVMGLSHVVMPDSRGQSLDPAKYADTAVADLAAALADAGCTRAGIQAVICGGASMFPNAPGGDIGAANVTRIRQELRRLHIPLRGEAVGGNRGRTLRACVGDGRVAVSTAGAAEVELWHDGALPLRATGGAPA